MKLHTCNSHPAVQNTEGVVITERALMCNLQGIVCNGLEMKLMIVLHRGYLFITTWD